MVVIITEHNFKVSPSSALEAIGSLFLAARADLGQLEKQCFGGQGSNFPDSFLDISHNPQEGLM